MYLKLARILKLKGQIDLYSINDVCSNVLKTFTFVKIHPILDLLCDLDERVLIEGFISFEH
jgi:hypothetical protein